MGVILYSTFKSSNNIEYTVQILDNLFNAAATEFKTDSTGFNLEYSGETDDIVSPVISSMCTVGMYVESIGQESLLIDNLKLYQEDRYFIRILKNTSLFWTGKITQDLVTLEDQYYPYLYQIKAVDGIGLLANEEYTNFGNKTIFEVFKESIDLLNISGLYSGVNFYLSTCFNTWDINQTYNADNDVTKLTRFNTFVYRETNDDGSFTAPKALDILKDLCTLFGARIYQRRGSYVIEQYKERDNTSYRYFNYDTSGAELTVDDKTDDVTINQTSAQGARLNGGSYNFLPALKKVEATYNQIRLNNLLANRLVFTGASSAVNLGTVVNDDNGQLNISGNLFYSFLFNGNGTPPSITPLFYRPVFRMQLKQEDILNPGTFYYLKRDFIPGGGNAVYGPTSWSTSASYYFLDAGVDRNSLQGFNLASTFNVISPPLPVDGLASLDIEFFNVYDLVGTQTSVPTNYTDTATINEVSAMYLNNGTPGTSIKVFTSTNGSAKVKSNLTLDLGELILGDSAGMDGSLYVYNGSGWVPSQSWRRGNSGSYINLYKLLTKEILSFYPKPVQRYSGSILAPYTYGTRLLWSNDYYLPTGVSYNAGNDEYSGEWFVIDSDDSQITIGTPVDSNPVDATFKTTFDGQAGTTNVVLATDGNIAGMNLNSTTKAIGPYSETATGGKITGTAVVTGNTTLSGTLGVTGLSTLGATSVGSFATTNQVAVTINSITATAAGNETIDGSKHFNFISYSGGTGSYNITLPPAEDGVILRFKTDDTIAANKTIILQGDGSERIDGEGNYTMNRSYDGISLLGKDSSWFIIQKKEK